MSNLLRDSTLPSRVLNLGAETFEQLALMTEDEILSTPGVSYETLKVIKAALRDRGLRLSDDSSVPRNLRLKSELPVTLRDLFAGMAMQGQVAFEGMMGKDPALNAAMAFKVADAMLAAREKNTGGGA